MGLDREFPSFCGSDGANSCRILTAHGDNEFVFKSDLYKAVEGYKKLINLSLKSESSEVQSELK